MLSNINNDSINIYRTTEIVIDCNISNILHENLICKKSNNQLEINIVLTDKSNNIIKYTNTFTLNCKSYNCFGELEKHAYIIRIIEIL